MQPHYGFRAFKPKLELFLKLANRGCGSFLSSRKRWGNFVVTSRAEMQEQWVSLSFPVGSWTSCTSSGENSSHCPGVWGEMPGGFEGKMECHRVTVSLCHLCSTATPRHTQIPFLPLLPSLSFKFLPLFWKKQWLACGYNTELHQVISSMNQTVETLEFCTFLFFSLFLFFTFILFRMCHLLGDFQVFPFFDNFYILLLSYKC